MLALGVVAAAWLLGAITSGTPVADTLGPALDGRGAPRVQVPRAEVVVTVDGDLTEPAWSTAVRLTGFSQYAPVDQRPATEATEVRVFYTREAVHFGIVATAADPGKVRATMSKRDAIANDDRVTIYLDTFNDHRRAFFFGVNALGVQLDGVRTEGATSAGMAFGGSTDLSPDFRFDSKGRLTSTGYVVEVRIPFKSLRFPSSDPQRWAIQIVRDVPSTGAQDTWTDARRGASSFLAQSASLEGIERVARGVVTDLQPFITESVAGARDVTTRRFVRDRGTFDAGLNARLSFPALSLDATVNPDFSQVEADAGLVTVNQRFTLFLPERRPFFLEGIELFATPNQLVYTRQIANPVAGAKVTGKLGRLGVAYLSAVDEQPGEDAVFNVLRLRNDYGGNSVAGLTITDRRQGRRANTVVAADSRYVFRNLYYAEVQLGQSFSDEGDGRSQSAPIWKAEVDRTGRRFGFNYSLTGVGDRFRSEAGFVPRVGYRSFAGYNRLAFFGRPASFVQNVTIFGGPSRIWRYGGFGRAGQVEGNEQLFSFITLRGGWQLTPALEHSFYELDPATYRGLFSRSSIGVLERWAPSERIAGLLVTSATLTTPVFGRFNASVTISRGAVPIFVEGVDGEELRTRTSLTMRPSTMTRVEATLTSSRITRALDGSPFARVIIPRLKAELQPTRALFFRVVSQYEGNRTDAPRDGRGNPLYRQDGSAIVGGDNRSLRTDWLVQYEPTPGTIAFIGYGDTWGSPGVFDDVALRRRADGVFVKLAYLFRR